MWLLFIIINVKPCDYMYKYDYKRQEGMWIEKEKDNSRSAAGFISNRSLLRLDLLYETNQGKASGCIC